MMESMIELNAADGHVFGAFRVEPAGKPRGALVVLQEIFGVNGHMRGIAESYATDGFLVIAPALFDRVQRGYETGYEPEDIKAGVAIIQGLNWENTMSDVAATIDVARPAGKVGILGYCWGGTVAWVAAARVPGLACAVPFYGGGIPNMVGEKPKCPVMCHWGETDQSIPAQAARTFGTTHPEVLAHFYQAGHGFNCDQRASYHAESARIARSRTIEFLHRHVG